MSDDAMEAALADVGPELAEASDGEVVHWMDPKPMSVGAMGISLTAVGAFALGVAATLVTLAIADVVDPWTLVKRRRTADDA